MTAKILDHIWLWCHPAGAYNNQWNLPGKSAFSPIGAASYLGIKNAVMVVYADEPKPPFNDYALQFSGMDKVIWSIIGDGASKRNNENSDLRYVVDLKREFSNLQGGIMDDFFGAGRENLDKVKAFADKLHMVGLKLWIVLYGHQLEIIDLKKYLKLCDVISLWTWKAEELPLLEERLKKVQNMVPDKEIALGCYMWDFGNNKPISIADMEYQCDFALKKYNEGVISEIILLGSPLVGMDIETVEWSRKWIKSIQ
jgi:hypothetical protein